jgi:hypothetical protein
MQTDEAPAQYIQVRFFQRNRDLKRGRQGDGSTWPF